MRWVSSRTLIGLSLLPLIVSAAPDASQTSPAPAMCFGIPVDEPLIAGLASGQVMDSGQFVTLRFSNLAFACGQTLTGGGTDVCRNDWTFSLVLPKSAIQPGKYRLSDLSAQFSELFNLAGPEQGGGCSKASCRMSTDGIGEVSLTDTDATLELYSVDSQCITGKLAGFKDRIFPDSPNYNGAFFALPCSA